MPAGGHMVWKHSCLPRLVCSELMALKRSYNLIYCEEAGCAEGDVLELCVLLWKG